MSNKMLIDATHPEETRVVVVRDKRVEDFDFETASKRPLRGNIYLAKVTRVEPSLQAAFVEYGGNRHGFLAFSEIHPDYYQIPQADRAALLAEERATADAEEETERGQGRRRRRGGRGDRREAAEGGAPTVSEDVAEALALNEAEGGTEGAAPADAGADNRAEFDSDEAEADEADADEADADEADPDGADADEANADEADADEANADEANAHEANADEASADEANADEADADEADADEAGRGGSDDERADESRAPEGADETGGARDGLPPPPEGPGRPSSDDAPADLGRAIEQVRENIDADTDAASGGPIREAELVDEPTRPAEPGEGVEVSEATHEAASEATDPAEVPGPVDTEGAGPSPKPRRKRTTTRTTTPRAPRTKKTAEGLADPEVSDAEDEGNGDEEASVVTSVGGQDAMEEIPERRRTPPRRNYKIQEVIKRRQILLVQVVKEERGTKGAALTTYLSLAGRYSVLMPNTDRGGGVSRKITDNADRRRLKELMEDLEVPEGMGIILRTAGAARTKTEIKRDFEYLLRLWESVRELTLQSIAPKLVYEEGNLVKRAIRDLYGKEIDEILVAGEPAYKEARDFMRMLMPSHAKNVKLYREPTPIFTQYGIEPQLDAMFSPQVTLPSKGYIVINPTEALVSIDVNSGRSTKESNIEETAYKTNLEAADEVARQLRLRDLAGLIVIDFIDMDDKRHNRAVEKRLKDALKLDRSRIQVGHISPFGLLEMSRQRIRQGMVETSMVPCPSCGGTGHVRSTQSVALHCLRALEEHLLKHGDHHVTVRTTTSVALYILNQKRAHLNALEQRFDLTIGVEADETIVGQHLSIVPGARVERVPGEAPPVVAMVSPAAASVEDEAADGIGETEAETDADADVEDEVTRAEVQAGEGSAERSGRRRRRRRRRGGGPEAEREAASDTARAEPDASTTSEIAAVDDEDDTSEDVGDEAAAANTEGGEESESERRGRRRRGRRGGRRHRREGEMLAADEVRDEEARDEDDQGEASQGEDDGDEDGTDSDRDEAASVTEAAAERSASNGSAAREVGAGPAAETESGNSDEADVPDAADSVPATADAAPAEDEAMPAQADQPSQPAEGAPEQNSQPRARRVGWWQRRSFF